MTSLAFLAGCQSNVADPNADEHGFETTTLGDGGTFALKSKEALRGYDRIFLQSVVAEPTPGTGGGPIEQSEMAALEYAYENSFRTVVGPAIPVVSAPGENVLLIEATVMNVVILGDGFDGPTVIDGGAMEASGLPLIDGATLGVGDLSIRLQVRDAMTGDLLATFKDDTVGDSIESISGKTSWSRVSDAFNRWNRELKNQLVEAAGE